VQWSHAAFGPRFASEQKLASRLLGVLPAGLAAAGRPELVRIPTVTRSHRDGRRPAVAGQERRGAPVRSVLEDGP
jgi:hypothetical protein